MKCKVISSLMAVMMAAVTIGGNIPVSATDNVQETAIVKEVEENKAASNEYGLVSVTQGNILHAWDWTYKDIKENMKTIAEAGYSVVQTSPAQKCEDFSTNNDWWKIYQPYDYAFGNSLGTESEFKEMCQEAEKYGVHIIVDIVANHVAGSSDGNIKEGVDSWWKNNKDSYFHNTGKKFTGEYDENRGAMVTYNIGMPDINTENSEVQSRLISYLEELLDMGADGFRFDAAKHIGTSTESGDCKSDFWKNIASAVKKKNSDALVYGEILNGMPISDELYVKDGIKVTESQKGWDMKDIVQGGASKVSEKTAFTYTRKASASNLITWVENHDTYLNHWGSTGLSGHANYMSDDQIILAWSTVAARAEAQALFYARPDGCSAPNNPDDPDASNKIDGKLGISTKNTIWKNKAVAAVNKFKNAMTGESEKTSTKGGTAIIVRGTKGVVATNFDSGESNLEVSGLSGLKDGTYEDASGQNGSFTVSGGKVTGNIKGKSFAVIYDAEEGTSAATATPTAKPTDTETATPTAKATEAATPTAKPTANPTAKPTDTPTMNQLNVSLDFSKTSPQYKGTKIKLFAKVSGGTAPYSYTFVITKPSGLKAAKTFSEKGESIATYWTPDKVGTYKIQIDVKDANQKSTTVTKTFKIKKKVKELNITSFKASPSTAKVKGKVTLTAKATAKKGTVKYKFEVKGAKAKKRTVVKNYSTKASAVWKPKKAGSYTIYVTVKDGSGEMMVVTQKIKVKK